MTRTDLIKELAEQADVSTAVAQRVVVALFGSDDGVLSRSLQRGESVAIRGFGTFEVRERAPRLLAHPRTGERLQLPPGRVAAWRPAKRLKTLING